MPEKPTSREARRRHCIFKFEGGIECPCWGESLLYGETDQGDKLFTCEGHGTYSLSDTKIVNRASYRPEP